MAFQDDVNKKIHQYNTEQEAKKAKAERQNAEKLQKDIQDVSNCWQDFYSRCVKAAAEGKHELTMYAVRVLGTNYSAYELISQKQGQQAINSYIGVYDEPKDEDYHRFAKIITEDIAKPAANVILKKLQETGLPNADVGLFGIYKWESYYPLFCRHDILNERHRQTDELAGFYIQLSASW